jgi:glycosyltransferase involved in cell wall biosynthesis
MLPSSFDTARGQDALTGVSAYVPCFNNAQTIRGAVDSLLRQTVPPDEVIVVDDGSVDESVAALCGLDVRIVRDASNLGRGAVRAKAMDEASQPFVLCCDATNALEPTFVATALDWFRDEHVAAVVGRITQLPGRTVVERWRGRHLFKLDVASEARHRSPLSTGGTMVRAAAVRAVGGYDPRLRHTEDGDLGARLAAAGYDVVYDPRLQVLSNASNSLGQVLERHWRWYAGSSEPISWVGYLKAISYSAKVMVAADLREGDWGSAAISVICPHHHFWLTVWRRLTLERW